MVLVGVMPRSKMYKGCVDAVTSRHPTVRVSNERAKNGQLDKFAPSVEVYRRDKRVYHLQQRAASRYNSNGVREEDYDDGIRKWRERGRKDKGEEKIALQETYEQYSIMNFITGELSSVRCMCSRRVGTKKESACDDD